VRITRISERSVRLRAGVANAVVNFSQHTVSLVAVHTDALVDGRPVVGLAFDSIGRFAQGGILRDRMIPRVLGADPDDLVDADGWLSPAKLLARAMTDEKPGGHGDRAAAAAALELAAWDAVAKAREEPAYRTIARHFGRTAASPDVPVYAAGGYYYPGADDQELRRELRSYAEHGYRAFKIKIGGAALATDLRRIETAIEAAGDGAALSVDANGRLDRDAALAYAAALAPYGLRWFEEPGDPLDFALNQDVIGAFAGPVATGENLFSHADVRNLLRHGGLRPRRDILQMDAGLSYGITEYARMIDEVEAQGFDWAWMYPHGGHLLNLHIVAALGLGGCEAYPGVFQPFGGFATEELARPGFARPGESPGFGLEDKAALRPEIAELLAATPDPSTSRAGRR
jgi:D(-)-tartrate dehydratase